MTPQEKIIVAIAEVQWLTDYRECECSSDTHVNAVDLQEDLFKIDNILNEVLTYVHQTNEKDTTIDNPVKAKRTKEPA